MLVCVSNCSSTLSLILTLYLLAPDPHIGHLYSLVLADILARYRRLVSSPIPTANAQAPAVRFITGTDEHGLKIQKAARDKGVSEPALVDALGERFKVRRALLIERDLLRCLRGGIAHRN